MKKTIIGIFVQYDPSINELLVKDKYFSFKPKYKINPDEIKAIEAVRDNEVISKSGLGGAIVGNILAGGFGMVTGAIIGKRDKAYVDKLSIKIILKDGVAVEVPFITSRTKVNSRGFKSIEDTFQQSLALLESLI